MEGQSRPADARLRGQSTAGLDPASLDAMALLDFFSASTTPADVLPLAARRAQARRRAARRGRRPGRLGADQKGIDAEDALSQAAAAGFKREAESGIVPGHFAIRFRKP
jgi:hypothetical protein